MTKTIVEFLRHLLDRVVVLFVDSIIETRQAIGATDASNSGASERFAAGRALPIGVENGRHAAVVVAEDAIKPWQYRSWIFPRDPLFEDKAARVLNLYQGLWNGIPLGADEYVISTDEKTSIQAWVRRHDSLPPRTENPMRGEHEYRRGGALSCLAAWDVRRAKVFGRCEPTSGIAAFDRLVDEVMNQEP